MGYVAVEGGQKAIAESNLRLAYQRVQAQKVLAIGEIKSGLKLLIDQVMSESSLYDETLAALALKQAQGSTEEAVFLLRAHRSTLPRLYYTKIIDTRSMAVKRRISASFKDVLGGQILGTSLDFKQRFLDFDLMSETKEQVETIIKQFQNREIPESDMELHQLPKVLDYLVDQGLLSLPESSNQIDDITKKSLQFPSSRSQRLQTLTRGQTGAVIALGYAEIRSYGIANHPNIGELRVGELPLYIDVFQQEDSYYIGSITVTEVESFIPVGKQTKDTSSFAFEIGYGLVFGHNESKAIAMSVLDHSLSHPKPQSPTSNDEFVLLHVDTVEASGFISHLKLPHYVTFQSTLDGIRNVNKESKL